MATFSAVPVLDKAIEFALKDQAKKAGIDICNSSEVEMRMSQTEYETGELLWKIDDKPVLKLEVQHLTEDVIVLTLEKIKMDKIIHVQGNRVIVPEDVPKVGKIIQLNQN